MTEKYLYIVVNLLKIAFIDGTRKFLVRHSLNGYFYIFHMWKV